GSFVGGFKTLDSAAYKGIPQNIQEYIIANFSVIDFQRSFAKYRSGKLTAMDFAAKFKGSIFDSSFFTKNPNIPIISIVRGVDHLGKEIIIVDKNGNKDFSDDVVIVLPDWYKTKRSLRKADLDSLPLITIPYTIKWRNAIYHLENKFKIIGWNSGVEYAESFFNKHPIDIVSFGHKEGEFFIEGKQFRVAASNQLSLSNYYPEYTQVTISEGAQPFKNFSVANLPYKISESFYWKDYEIKFDSVAPFGDTIWYRLRKNAIPPTGYRIGEFAPEIRSQDIQTGQKVQLSSKKGKYVLLDFWATWCIPCMEIIPLMEELNTNKPIANLEIIGIAFDDLKDLDNVRKFTFEHRTNKWLQLLDDKSSPDFSLSILKKYRIDAIPAYVLIDPEGKIIFRGNGKSDFERLTDLIAKLKY
ncbi:MAG TPA: TlpA disulfide reductase family protein, partial [Niabella sp.]